MSTAIHPKGVGSPVSPLPVPGHPECVLVCTEEWQESIQSAAHLLLVLDVRTHTRVHDTRDAPLVVRREYEPHQAGCPAAVYGASQSSSVRRNRTLSSTNGK